MTEGPPYQPRERDEALTEQIKRERERFRKSPERDQLTDEELPIQVEDSSDEPDTSIESDLQEVVGYTHHMTDEGEIAEGPPPWVPEEAEQDDALIGYQPQAELVELADSSWRPWRDGFLYGSISTALAIIIGALLVRLT